jgi:glycosyltransferase involved in cell wall biosynthesis
LSSALRVVLTVDYSPWSAFHGGSQHFVHQLALALSRRSHRVEVVYTKPPWEKVHVPEGLPYTVHWAAFLGLRSVRHASFRPLNGFPVARTVRRLMRQRQGLPLVVHGNGEEASRLGALRSRGHFGLVVSPHYGMYPEAYLKDARSWRDHVAVLVREPRYVALRHALESADLCCPPSAFAADLVQRAYRLSPERMRIIPGGVSAPFMEAPASEPDPAGPAVYIGRFTRIRGVDVLLDAIERLEGQGPPFLLIGRPERDADLQHRIGRLEGRGMIRVRHWASQEELATILRGASMAVVPSRYESFGLAAAEAMACGVPVIASRAGALPELVRDGETGMLVPAGDAGALAEAIRYLHTHRAQARVMGQAARSLVRSRYSWDAVAAAYEQAYEDALGEGHAGAT